jgi:Tol biopolymer transport system component
MRGRYLGATIAVLLALPAAATAATANSTLLVSRPDGLGPVPLAFDNTSTTPGAVSSGGRYAAFTSQADGFAPGINPFVQNVLLRDTQSNTTTLVSRSDGTNGAGVNEDASAPAIAIAPTGVMTTAPTNQPHVLVTFTTGATNLVDHATGAAINPGGGPTEVWMRDVTAGTTTLISRADGLNGAVANSGGADDSSIDVAPGGPVVAFATNATNLGTALGGGVFLRTVNSSGTELISCHNQVCTGPPTGAQANDPSVRVIAVGPPPEIVDIAFDTNDKTLTGDAAGNYQIVLARATAPSTSSDKAGLVSAYGTESVNGSSVVGNAESMQPSLDSDGTAVAFHSSATNLTSDTLPTNTEEGFVHTIGSPGSTVLVSRATGASGAAADQGVRRIALGGTASSLRATFDSPASNLGGGGSMHLQAYVRDVSTNTTSVLNRGPGSAGALGDGFGSDPTISPDGSAALFTSTSTNLGDFPGNRFERVHLRTLPPNDVTAGSVQLISRPSGTAPFHSLTDESDLAVGKSISADGRYVAFTSQSDSLSSVADQRFFNSFVRDVLLNRTILISRASGAAGAPANGDSEIDGITGDGRRVVFDSDATNLSPLATNGTNEVYVRDLVANTTTLVSRASGAGGAPAATDSYSGGISADGKAVVIQTRAVLDPAGTSSAFHLYVRNLSTNTTTLVDRDNGAAGAVESQGAQEDAIDANGGRVVWDSKSAIAGAPADNRDHVFLRDLAAGTTTLVSRADGPSGASANRDSRAPTLDANGDAIVFTTNATNLAGTVGTQVFLRTVSTGHTQLVSQITGFGQDLPFDTENPSIDAAGDRVAFSGFFGAPGSFAIFVRDLPSQTTVLASRASGATGALAGGRIDFSSINATGDCVAFEARPSELGEGLNSPDFNAVHLRVLRGQCPIIPTLGGLRIKPHRVHTRGRRRGATIRFTLSGPTNVTLRFYRLLPGRRKGRRCVANRRRGHRCTATRFSGQLTIPAVTGQNVVRFNGRVGGKRLARGRYLLTATPDGGASHTIRFTITH